MPPATAHFTADNLRVPPTPTIEPVSVCVVETGVPVSVTYASVSAAALSAQNPPTGFSFVIRVPIVRTMRSRQRVCLTRLPRALIERLPWVSWTRWQFAQDTHGREHCRD